MASRSFWLIALVVCLVPFHASALPLLDAPESSGVASVSLDPGMAGPATALTLTVDPNGTPLSAFVLNFAVDPSGIELVSFTSSFSSSFDPVSGLFGVAGSFGTDQEDPFEIGTLELFGLSAGTELILTAGSNYTDAGYNDILVGPLTVGAVVPEPATGLLVALGTLALAAARRLR
jgi:hypothetical protein